MSFDLCNLTSDLTSPSLLQFTQRPQQFLDIRQFADAIYPGEGDLSAFIDNECGTLADSGDRGAFPQNVEFARDLGMRIEVRAQGNRYRADFFLAPSGVTGNRINADVQNLGIERRELFLTRIEFGHLDGSCWRPVERVEGDDEILFPETVAGTDRRSLFAHNSGKFEIRRGVTDL